MTEMCKCYRNISSDDNDICIARDINHLFKFHIGEKVRKTWKWSKESYGRYSATDLASTCPIGTIGTIKNILPDGTLCVSWSSDRYQWHFGASEMDLVAVEANDA